MRLLLSSIEVAAFAWCFHHTYTILMADNRTRESLNCPFNDPNNVINKRAAPCTIKHGADLVLNKNYSLTNVNSANYESMREIAGRASNNGSVCFRDLWRSSSISTKPHAWETSYAITRREIIGTINSSLVIKRYSIVLAISFSLIILSTQ